MMRSDKRRFGIAVVFSFLAHGTALVVLFPIYAAIQAAGVLAHEENETLRVSLVLAVLIHVALILPAVHWILSISPKTEDGGIISLEIWPDKEALKDLEEAEEKKTPEEELDEYEPEEEIPEGQVVQAPPSEDRRPPEEKPRFLAEHDSRVEEETRSSIRMPGVSRTASRLQMEGKGKDSETMPGGMKAELDGVAPLPSDLQQAQKGDVSADSRAPVALENINLNPSMAAMASALAGTGLDNLENVIDADHTALNTAGWQYASFFNRVKRKVEQYWHPDVEYRRRDPYGNIYGFKDRVTVLLLVLRGDGSLKKLYVMNPSGAKFLDDEAYKAVSRAAPFPNVPNGLKDRKDGLVKFTFHFIVEVGERPVLRMRRYR